MPLYAVVDSGVITEWVVLDTVPSLPGKPNRKILLVEDTNPPATANQIKTGPVITVEATRVTRVWTVRDMTQIELDASKDNQIDSIGEVFVWAIRNHENRIRSLERNNNVATFAQVKAFLRGLMP